MTKKPKKAPPNSNPSSSALKTKALVKEDEEGRRRFLQVWVPADVYTWMEERAKADERTLASYVRRILGRVKDDPKILQQVSR